MLNQRTCVLSLTTMMVLNTHARSQDVLSQPFSLDRGYRDVSRYCCGALERPIEQSLFSEDDSLSLVAAWSLVRNDVLDDKQEESQPIGRRADRFLGFIEGRLKIDLPTWWEEEMREGFVFQNQCSFARDRPLWSMSKKRPSSKLRRRLFTGVDDISSDEQYVVLQESEQSVRLKRSLFRDFTDEVEDRTGTVLYQVAATIDDQYAYFCTCGFSSPRHLYCVDRQTGGIVWDSDVDGGTIPDRGASGSSDGHYGEVFTTGDSLIVLGVRDIAMYLQVFSKANGQMRVRFATSYLDLCDEL